VLRLSPGGKLGTSAAMLEWAACVMAHFRVAIGTSGPGSRFPWGHLATFGLRNTILQAQFVAGNIPEVWPGWGENGGRTISEQVLKGLPATEMPRRAHWGGTVGQGAEYGGRFLEALSGTKKTMRAG